ncbi:MAG: hypothetical protein UR85_C0010G0029 [Candidatus Nomurabacteria bacterium GW2011_GWF2_35_66]|uniref:Uncharacterized protein n=1 Tax=Candidatus Nomurabacteria bacterium GW2011_GWE1_35_16 TaxID=1618761 RepID=A0A0G0DS96_9BACT|nr:MAG: hypothetical protein UR55_C0016G0026 [Candidatus Nomurabacteria bacterium GW2011_GWF1_34_20]KKP61632.1 MAG: hypothetical protein UR57_C0015G0028 [Candidatus Nomurabacteria bacterium GW2011_GWE2_34_25]KKP65925.1 MAG: hypothetical protein UR64_C0016G0025 [Candidatus Nomurabacteria bacterium GW2011_GWE1_35_16]KKP82981.1 MAG: hypothetical protein UR85_C0010G0029 [Candidatus Nomurabacteria bacterium GW2011_GWF2_35_66]HAE36295.1 hypothetical protein [Candidatus Nomurabacteria bacterium]
MESQSKICQNCKLEFIIEPEDFSFYEKMKVPPPTFCPNCRLQRRMSWRNDWHLFKKTNSLSGKKIFSLFPEESPVKIYDRDYWISDDWDPTIYGKDYDFSRTFFEQFKELLHTVPLPAHSMVYVTNCEYCTNANNIKGCYLVRGASFTEDSAYLIWDQESKECLDSHMTSKCELSYGNVDTVSCYKTFFSVDCESCQDTILCKDCVGCNSCIGSVGLRNKSYYIFNQPYTKEDYLIKLAELNIGSQIKFSELKNKSYANWLKYPVKYIHDRQNNNVLGDYIYESKNALNCFRVRGVEDSKFIQNILTGPVKDCYDYANYGDNVELIYESLVVGSGMSNIKFSTQVVQNGKNLTYCIFCFPSCSNLFGCISLRKKEYCILNKQYTKEEYEELIPKIIEHMKTTSEYGEFFPSSLSPWPYQATAAYEFFPLEEETAKKQGFLWYPTLSQDYKITLKNIEIPDDIQDVDKNILNEIIECAHQGNCQHECVGAFRVIEKEVDFCKRMNIPLPRLCPNCRHYGRLELRNPPHFYHRKCMHDGCTNEFETSYAPDRPEIVYCEKCYQQEVY